MADYTYPDDGLIHTRFSELDKLTRSTLPFVIKSRYDGTKINNNFLQFGTLRHVMWAEESRQTGKLPQCFIERYPIYGGLKADMVEYEMVTEVFQGVFLHSTLDFADLSGYLVDYKTVSEKKKASDYKVSKQHLVYAYQLLLRDIQMRSATYLMEKWDTERENLKGYDSYEIQLKVTDIVGVRGWLEEKVNLLIAGIELYNQGLIV